MIDTRTHRVAHVDPMLFTRGSAVQRERDMQHMRWADEHGRPWTLRRLTLELAAVAAVIATPFILWSLT